jgi:hypothetical protein
VRFASVADLRDAIERILAPLGRRVDEAEPLCDARLPDRRRLACKTEKRRSLCTGRSDVAADRARPTPAPRP